MQKPLATLDYPESELVIGLVYPVGTDYRIVLDAIRDYSQIVGYSPNIIRLSEYLTRLGLVSVERPLPEHDRIRVYMDAGNRARSEAARSDFLCLLAISEISRGRELEPDAKTPRVRPRNLHVIQSLKRPEEVVSLQRIYGTGFFLIGVHADDQVRLRHLEESKGVPRDEALRLMRRDQDERESFGQRTRETFHLADAFVDLEDANDCKRQLFRFLDLLFGAPFETPTSDENAMFLAYSASLRSADLSRQVGAAIAQNGEVVAVGCNDVPKPGGGLYWPEEGEQRDYKLGFDSNTKRRDEMIVEIMGQLRRDITEDQRLATGRSMLQGSLIMDISEFGRAVHAEMAALLACARTGVSPVGATLYTTTFPCHNCTRHIVGAGISRVVYIEPYAKSRAEELHFDAVRIEEHGHEGPARDRRVGFEPFVGVGPRRYFDLFSTRLSTGYPIVRKNADGSAVVWNRGAARPRVPMLPTSYLQREQLAVLETASTMKRLEEPTNEDGKIDEES
jgi:deoxycytidylate deaminase